MLFIAWVPNVLSIQPVVPLLVTHLPDCCSPVRPCRVPLPTEVLLVARVEPKCSWHVKQLTACRGHRAAIM